MVLMTPAADELQSDFTIVSKPGLTWRLRFDGKPSGGMLDGTEAVKQMIAMTLRTERYRHAIFSHSYGAELGELAGQPNDIRLQLRLQDAIEDAIAQDDRVRGVSAFAFTRPRKTAVGVSFRVETDQGAVPVRMIWEDGRIVEVE